MTLGALLERCAGYERRALLLYRQLAERFHGEPEAARRWRAMSDAEAAHFTTLRLAGDRAALAGAAAAEAGDLAAGLDSTEDRLRELEEAAGQPGLTLAEAVGLAVGWEELEVARIACLVAALPGAVRPHVEAGLLGQLAAHHDDLLALARASGVDSLERRVGVLRERKAVAGD
jgi:hypothetical protein